MNVDAVIRPSSTTPSDAFLRRLGDLDLPTIGHILEDGYTVGLTRLAGRGLAVGRVLTVRLVDTDSTLVHYVTRMVRPGDFVVIDPGPNTTHAPLGGVMAASFAAAGAVGTAVGGPCTDIDGLRESGLAVYGTGLAAVTTRRGPAVAGEINGTVTVGSVVVHPGMVAIGDENGLLITEPGPLSAVLDSVEQMMAGEPGTMRRIRDGERFGDFFLAPGLLAELDGIAAKGHRA